MGMRGRSGGWLLRVLGGLLLSLLVVAGLGLFDLGAKGAEPGPSPVPVKGPRQPPRSGAASVGDGLLDAQGGLPGPAETVASRALPGRFDWRDYGAVTPVGDQGLACNAGYAFSTVAGFESRLFIDRRGAFDLSENHAKECNWQELADDGGGTSCTGGNAQIVANLFSQVGTVLEADDPYVPADVECTLPGTTQARLLDWRLLSGRNQVLGTDVLKQYVMAYGPVMTALYIGDDSDPAWREEFRNFDGTYTLYHPGAHTPNHFVLLIGWDDSLPHDGGSGGWMVKNSWGTGWGAGGTFSIAYGSAGIGSSSSLVYDWRSADAGGELLYYDEAGGIDTFGFGGVTAWGLVTFTVPVTTYVTGVELWTTGTTTDVDVYLYDGFDGFRPGTLLASALDYGWLEAGYHPVPLASPLYVTGGTELAAAARVTNRSLPYPLAVDDAGPYETERTYASPGGVAKTWFDVGTYYEDVAIRVRTSASPPPAPAVTGIVPTSGAYTGTVQITDLSGSGFALEPGVTVRLARPGQMDVRATEVVVESGSRIRCRFDLTGAAAGAWDVVVRNPDGRSGRLPGGFAVSRPQGMDVVFYLPLMGRHHSEIVNGDFELGQVAWTESSVLGYPLIMPGEFLDRPPHGGRWAAWLGGLDSETSYLEQRVTIPAHRPVLHYWHWILSGENTCGQDVASVWVNGALVHQYDLCQAANTEGWAEYAVDLTDYAGQSVVLQLRVKTNPQEISDLYVDDVSLEPNTGP